MRKIAATASIATLTGSLIFLGAGVASADSDDNRGCPEGWTYQFAGFNDVYDKNGDGIICTKFVEGKGNSGQRNGSEAGHVPGHNHKDNNNPNPLP